MKINRYKPDIQIVVVLYKCGLTESSAAQSILQLHPLLCQYFAPHIVVYNNSPEVEIPGSPLYDVKVSDNSMALVGAYNYALQTARDKNYGWMVCFDQDTTITAEYVVELYNAMTEAEGRADIGAIVPKLWSTKQLSPVSYNPIIGPKWMLRSVESGVTAACVYAFNSATAVRVEALVKIGGFPAEYKLDDLDICYFYRLYRSGYKTLVMNTVLSHSLSTLDYNTLSEQRYENIMISDRRMAKEIGFAAEVALCVRVLFRIVKQLFVKNKRRFLVQTITLSFKSIEKTQHQQD